MTRFERALITGASSGLGRAIALELARRGTARFVLAARRRRELEELAGELSGAGAQADVCPLDVADASAVIEAVRTWDERIGGFDLVVANAGVGRARAASTLEWEHIAPVLAVNVTGAIATLWAAMGMMLVRKRGLLVGISSVAGMRGLPNSGAYSASKAALSTFLETLSIDLARTGVRTLDIRPGFVRTPMTEDNAFPMPFLIGVEDAARRCVRAMQRGKTVATFPVPMSLAMKLVHRLPSAVWRFLGRNFNPKT